MRRHGGPTVALAALGALLALAAIAAAVAGQCIACTAGGIVDAYSDPDPDRFIPVGWTSHHNAKDCARKGSCPSLAGIAYADVDITQEMQGYEESASFIVHNDYGYPSEVLTKWLVCSFDDVGDLLDCHFDREAGWGASAEIPAGTSELRLLVIEDMLVEYHLEIFVH